MTARDAVIMGRLPLMKRNHLRAGAFSGLDRFIHIFDALRLGFIDQNKPIQMKFEFTNLLGTQ
jgi:hypothetical protein